MQKILLVIVLFISSFCVQGQKKNNCDITKEDIIKLDSCIFENYKSQLINIKIALNSKKKKERGLNFYSSDNFIKSKKYHKTIELSKAKLIKLPDENHFALCEKKYLINGSYDNLLIVLFVYEKGAWKAIDAYHKQKKNEKWVNSNLQYIIEKIQEFPYLPLEYVNMFDKFCITFNEKNKYDLKLTNIRKANLYVCYPSSKQNKSYLKLKYQTINYRKNIKKGGWLLDDLDAVKNLISEKKDSYSKSTIKTIQNFKIISPKKINLKDKINFGIHNKEKCYRFAVRYIKDEKKIEWGEIDNKKIFSIQDYVCFLKSEELKERLKEINSKFKNDVEIFYKDYEFQLDFKQKKIIKIEPYIDFDKVYIDFHFE